jgi:NAD(P)-dependent dehydrogenase (short-subunit alcohol dehydrogenase family)
MAPDTLSLAGKVAIVTGSGREPGIGAGTAEALARNGASVILNYLSDGTGPMAEKLAKRLNAEYNGTAVAIQENIESQEGADRLVKKTLKALNTDHIDILGSPYLPPRLAGPRATWSENYY